MQQVANIAFVTAIPKVELHLHIEGSLEPEMLFMLAKRNNVAIPFDSVDAVRKAYNFSCLQDFLDIYYQGMSVLLHEQDFYDLTWAYFKRIAQDGVVHTEIFFDPQGHLERPGVTFEIVVKGITRAMKDAREKLFITSHLIMCFLRHLSEDAALQTLVQARPFVASGDIIGVGLDSSEKGHPPEKFKNVFAEAKKLHLRLVAHAGEEGPHHNVTNSLDVLKVERIDHGVRAEDSEELMTRLGKCRTGLTMCPLSNQKLQATPDLAKHPAKKFIERNMCVSLNSDDPAYFGGYMVDNYMALVDALHLTRQDVAQIAMNSVESSFMTPEQKAVWTSRIQLLCKAVASSSSTEAAAAKAASN